MKKQVKKEFDLNLMRAESNIEPTRSSRVGESSLMMDKLNALKIKESYRIPMNFKRVFNSARTTLHKKTAKVFIMRTLDKYNIRVWRVEDGTKLKTKRS